MPSVRHCQMRFCNVFRENFTAAIDKRRIVSYTDKKSGETVMIASRRFFAYIYYYYFMFGSNSDLCCKKVSAA